MYKCLCCIILEEDYANLDMKSASSISCTSFFCKCVDFSGADLKIILKSLDHVNTFQHFQYSSISVFQFSAFSVFPLFQYSTFASS